MPKITIGMSDKDISKAGVDHIVLGQCLQCFLAPDVVSLHLIQDISLFQNIQRGGYGSRTDAFSLILTAEESADAICGNDAPCIADDISQNPVQQGDIPQFASVDDVLHNDCVEYSLEEILDNGFILWQCSHGRQSTKTEILIEPLLICPGIRQMMKGNVLAE